MAVWAPTLRPAGYRAAEVDPSFIETEVFERLDSDSSGYLTLAEMEPLIAMSSNSKFKLRFRVATAIRCGGQPEAGLSLRQFVAVFREDVNKSVLKYYEQGAAEEMDSFAAASPQTGRWRQKSKMGKMLEAADLEAELKAAARPLAARPLASPSRGLLSTSPQQITAADLEADLQAAALTLCPPNTLTVEGVGPSPAESLGHEARVRSAAIAASRSPPSRRSAERAERSRSPLGPAASPASPTATALDPPASGLEAEGSAGAEAASEAVEASMEKAVEVAVIPSNPKAGGKIPAGNSQGSKSGQRGPRKSTVDAPADIGTDSAAANPVKSTLKKWRFPAKSDKDGQETHRNRDEVRNQILDVLKASACLQQVDFDSKVRQHLHAILCHSGHAKLREALVAVSDISAKKKRTDVRNWAAYIVKILQSFHSHASAAAVEEVAEDEGAKPDELCNAMAEIQRLKEELAAKEKLARDAALPARQRASMGAMLAPESDSEDEADEVDDQDDLDMIPAPPDSQSWEWPLSRHEKKVRVQLLERQIHAADRSALIKEVKGIRRASLASARNACPSDDEK